MTRFLVGFLLAIGTILGALLLEGGNGLTLLGASAFLIVWFVPFFASSAIWGFRAWTQAWGAAFRRVDPAVAKRSAHLWTFNEFAFFLTGVLALLLGLSLILSNWNDPTPARLGWAFGAALVGPLYGFFFAYMARILKARVEAMNA